MKLLTRIKVQAQTHRARRSTPVLRLLYQREILWRFGQLRANTFVINQYSFSSNCEGLSLHTACPRAAHGREAVESRCDDLFPKRPIDRSIRIVWPIEIHNDIRIGLYV